MRGVRTRRPRVLKSLQRGNGYATVEDAERLFQIRCETHARRQEIRADFRELHTDVTCEGLDLEPGCVLDR